MSGHPNFRRPHFRESLPERPEQEDDRECMAQQGGGSTNWNPVNPYQSYECPSPPRDSVSCLRWHPGANLFGVSSWDGSVSVYHVERNQGRFRGTGILQVQHECPVLTCCVAAVRNASQLISAGCDQLVKVSIIPAQSGGQTRTWALGRHDAPVSDVFFHGASNMVVSCSWDKTIRYWDIRASNGRASNQTQLPDRVYTMDLKGNILVAGLAGNNYPPVAVYDLRNPGRPLFQLKSPLRKITRKVCVFPSTQGYAVGSIEGRVGIVKFNDFPPHDQRRESFNFKCHREGREKNMIYPINDLSYHPRQQVCLSTIGSNGRYNFWHTRSRRRTFWARRRFKMPLTAGQFSQNDGQIFAVCVGYDFTQGTDRRFSGFTSKILLLAVEQRNLTPREN